MNSVKMEKDRTLKDELAKLVGAQHATGDHWRTNCRKNEEMEPKLKQHPVVDVTGDGSKVQCCREKYCTRSWNVRSILLLLSRFSRGLTLCDPIDGSPPGSPIPGILQARTLEWVAITFSNA